jgi:hypothetical protein
MSVTAPGSKKPKPGGHLKPKTSLTMPGEIPSPPGANNTTTTTTVLDSNKQPAEMAVQSSFKIPNRRATQDPQNEHYQKVFDPETGNLLATRNLKAVSTGYSGTEAQPIFGSKSELFKTCAAMNGRKDNVFLEIGPNAALSAHFLMEKCAGKLIRPNDKQRVHATLANLLSRERIDQIFHELETAPPGYQPKAEHYGPTVAVVTALMLPETPSAKPPPTFRQGDKAKTVDYCTGIQNVAETPSVAFGNKVIKLDFLLDQMTGRKFGDDDKRRVHEALHGKVSADDVERIIQRIETAPPGKSKSFEGTDYGLALAVVAALYA